MSGSEIAANMIFSAGWVAVGTAAFYARRKRAAREAEAERPAAVPEKARVHAASTDPRLEAVWASDLAALASAIGNAAAAPELEHEYAAPVGQAVSPAGGHLAAVGATKPPQVTSDHPL